MTRRSALLAGAFALAVSVTPARALLGVGDIVFDPAVHAEMLAQIEVARDTLNNGREALGVAKEAYDAANTVTGLAGRGGSGWRSGLPGGGAMAGLLNGSPAGGLLGDAAGLAGDVARFTTPGWSRGGIEGLVASFITRDQVYEAPGEDFQTAELRRSRRALAGRKSVQQIAYEQFSEREAAMAEIEMAARTARTQAEKDDVRNRWMEESAKIAALNANLGIMRARADEEERNTALRQREQMRMGLDMAFEQLRGVRQQRLGGGTPAALVAFQGGPS